eukprot:8506131-Pyramimonas_sp.AAC.1
MQLHRRPVRGSHSHAQPSPEGIPLCYLLVCSPRIGAGRAPFALRAVASGPRGLPALAAYSSP